MTKAENPHSEELLLAGFGRRLTAWLVDTGLLVLLVLILRPFPSGMEVGLNLPTLLFGAAVWFIMSSFYFIISWSMTAQTLGGSLTEIKIIRLDHRELGFTLCLWRFAVYIIALLPLGFGLWGMIFDKFNQTWADHAANTVVIKIPKMKKNNGLPTAV